MVLCAQRALIQQLFSRTVTKTLTFSIKTRTKTFKNKFLEVSIEVFRIQVFSVLTQFLLPMFCGCAEKLLVQMDAGLYFFINQGCLTVDNMNDKEEMDIVDVSGSLLFLAYRREL